MTVAPGITQNMMSTRRSGEPGLLRKWGLEHRFWKFTADTSQMTACGELETRDGPEARRMREALAARRVGEPSVPHPGQHVVVPHHSPRRPPGASGTRSLLHVIRDPIGWPPGVFQRKAFSGAAMLEALRKDLGRSAWDSFWKGLAPAREPDLDLVGDEEPLAA